MRRAFWILLTPLAFVMTLMVVGKLVIKPKLQAWTLEYIKNYSAKNLPVDIRAESLDLTLFRPSASLLRVLITPKDDLLNITEGLSIDRITVNVGLFDLISGKLKLSSLVVDSVAAQINIDPLLTQDSPPQQLPLDDLFELLEKIPLQRLFLQNVNISVDSRKLGFALETQNGGVLLSNPGKNLTGKVDIPSLYIQLAKLGDFTGAFNTHLYLTRQSLKLNQLGIKLDDSEIVAHGELTDFKNVMIKPTGMLDIAAQININDLYNEFRRIRPDLNIPTLGGELTTDLEVRFNGTQQLTGEAEISTRQIVVDKFKLGDAKILGNFKNRTISFSEVEVNHPAGKAKLNGSQITLADNFAFRSDIRIESLDLQKLFQSMDLHNIPTGVSLQGTLPCHGQALGGFNLSCENVQLRGDNLWVHGSNSPQAHKILELDQLSAQGDLSVTTESVAYAATLHIGSSQGETAGTIKYDEGFKINYSTRKLDFKDVRNLANLKFVGLASLEGFTQGDSDSATFSMKLNGRNFVFEDFNLGNLIMDLRYDQGHLLLENLAGALSNTQYLGALDVNLNDDRISGNLSLPSADLGDIAKIFENLYEFPLPLSGPGSARVHFDGPFDFWTMSYQLESQFKNISAGPETFDQLNFNVTSDGKSIRPQNVLLLKNESTLKLEGDISSSQSLHLLAEARNWHLDESASIAKINSTIVGNLNFSSELKGKVSAPHILLNGTITDSSLEEQDIPNSNFALQMNRQALSGQGSFFGDKVQGEFQLPFSKGSAPLFVKLDTREWNFSTLLAVIGGANLATEYESSLSSSINLHSESGDLFKATGQVSIPEFYLKRGNLMFRNKRRIDVNMDNGVTSIHNFELDGPGNNIQIKGSQFTAERLNIEVTAGIDLRLMQIFLPFLEDLGGPLRLSTSVSGRISKPQILGSTSLDNAYLRIKGFPHPIERLRSDVAFSHTKILVNSVHAQVAGGVLTGDGSVLIEGIRNLPSSIRLHLDNVTLNVPEKVRTKGDADLLLSGSWFPFTLSGTYNIESALIEKEFTEDTEGVAGVRQSVYLPRVLKESRFEPLVLDLHLIMERNIIVKNSMIDGAVTGALQVKGTPTAPVLLGKITTDKKTKLIFKDKVFDVTNGVVQFTDPYEMNPDLYVTATSRVNDYDITLLAQGSAKAPVIRLTSIPPLSEQDIISLIALGVTSSDQQNLQSKNQAQQTGFEIGAATLAKPLSKQLQSTLGLDLQFTSQFDSSRNISVPKVTLSRRISDKLKVSGSRPVGDDNSYDLKLEYQLNNNVTAIGSFENRGVQDNTSLQGTAPEALSIFGLDLEYKREFK